MNKKYLPKSSLGSTGLRTSNKSKDKTVFRISMKLPVAFMERLMATAREHVPETNIHSVLNAALGWFLDLEKKYAYECFFKVPVKLDSLRDKTSAKVQLSSSLIDELENEFPEQPLEETIQDATVWFAKKLVSETFGWFHPKQFTFLCNMELKKQIEAFMRETVKYAQLKGRSVTITETKVIDTAAREYLRWYLAKENNQ